MFQTVTRQLKRALSAAKSVLAIAGTAAAVLDPRLRSFLQEGEQLDGMETVQLTVVRWIEDDHQRLEEKESLQRKALRLLDQLRLSRDDRQKTLYTRLLRIRKTFEDAFGPGTARIFLGLGPKLNELGPQTLRRQARETVEILSDPELVTPKAEVDGLWENPLRYAEQVRDAQESFETTLDAIESQKREVEKAQKAKNDLLEEVDERLSWSIRLFEAIYHLAGLGFHADRLRVKFASRPSPEPGASSEPETEGRDDASPETPEPAAATGSSETEASAS